MFLFCYQVKIEHYQNDQPYNIFHNKCLWANELPDNRIKGYPALEKKLAQFKHSQIKISKQIRK
jgi:hypothetical protein